MIIQFIKQYSRDDLNNTNLKAELAKVFEVDDRFDWTGSYGLNCMILQVALRLYR